MKSISSGLKAHLAGGVTTLAVCWLIVRADGTQFAYTTLDANLTVGGVTYSSTHGFSRTAITTGSTGEVDDLEVLGYFSDDGITRVDLINGLFDYASIELFLVNWADLTQGILRLRRGWLGECVSNPDGSFHTELRGLAFALTQEFGNVYLPFCRADLGDAKCRVPIAPAAWQASAVYAADVWISPATKSTDALRTAIFNSGAGGTSGASEPTWDTTPGDVTTDGTVNWTAGGPFRLISAVNAVGAGSAYTTHSFRATLATGGDQTSTTAVISVRNNISSGSALEIDDGSGGTPIGVAWFQDTPGGLAADQIITAINAAVTAGTTSIRIVGTSGSTNITIQNLSPTQGNVTKTGDIANPAGLLITNFGTSWLTYGVLTWISGANAGTSIEIKALSGTTVQTWLGMNFIPQEGDRFYYTPGCDKTRLTCTTKFNNILNFRGEPDMPGLDAALAYPDVNT